jgi:hypothetical protein
VNIRKPNDRKSTFGSPKLVVSHDDIDQESMELLMASYLESAAKAREDVVAFFEFVMRDITGAIQGPLVMAPHQKVGLDFVMHHDRSVLMWPVSFSKTFCAAGLTLWMLGRDPEMRGAVISATEGQAQKIVTIVRDYIMSSPELKLVFPHLRPSTRPGDPWSQTAITVERRAGIKDNSLTAYAVLSDAILGSRLSWVIIDDVLSGENTATQEMREKIIKHVGEKCLTRLDPPPKGKVVMINTPWHPKDIVHHARDVYGWATLRMDILGDIEFWNDAITDKPFLSNKVPNPFYEKYWDCPLVRAGDQARQTSSGGNIGRLIAHDPDPIDSKLLWPEFRGWDFVEKSQRENLPITFNQSYRCIVRDDASSMCKTEYIETCKAVARQLAVYSMVSEYRGPNLTFTGIDLAFAPGEERDETAFFTFEARPGGINVILDIDVGQWPVPLILEKAFEKHERYGSFLMVENNGGMEMFSQFALRQNRSLPVKTYNTQHFTKVNPTLGIPAIFVELMNGAWAIPNTIRGEIHPMVKKWIDSCLYYVPDKHTFDVLMASFLARELKRQFVGLGGDPGTTGGPGTSIGMSIMSR